MQSPNTIMPYFFIKCIVNKTKHQTGYKSISIKTLMPETAKYISWKRVNLSKAKTFWQTGFVSSTIKLSTTGLIYHLRRSKTFFKYRSSSISRCISCKLMRLEVPNWIVDNSDSKAIYIDRRIFVDSDSNDLIKLTVSIFD